MARSLSSSRDVYILLEGRDPVRVLIIAAWHNQLGVLKVKILGASTSSMLLAREGSPGLATRQLTLVSTVAS